MIRQTRYLIALICLLLALQANAADWPQFRGPAANGIAPDTGINKDWGQKPPPVLWQVALTDGGYAGPSVAQGKVFIIDHQGDQDIVRAIDFKTGKDVWRFTYADNSKSDYGFSQSTPVFSEGKLYTISRAGKLHCLDAATGAKIWMKDFIADYGGHKPQWQYACSPFIDGNKLIITPGGDVNNVYALDKNTGATIWAGGTPDVPGYAVPVAATIQGVKQYVIMTGVSVMGVDAQSGKALWDFPFKNQCAVNAACPIVTGDFVFITTGYGLGCALLQIGPNGATPVWQNKEIIAHFNTPVYYKQCIFGVGDPDNLVCLNPRDGTALWKQPGFEKGGVVAVDDTVIAIAGKTGDMVMLSATPEAYKELGRIKPLGGQSWTAPIVSDGKLIVRNQTGMVCLDLK
jgi:outer membrane protein assembly factor BamB